MKHWMRHLLFLFVGIVLFCGSGCCVGTSKQELSCLREEESRSVDYSDAANWVLLPMQPSQELKPVDIFYIYPTIFSSETEPVMHWDDAMLAAKARNIALQQTGPFETLGNVYAPYVRQGELNRALKGLEVHPIRTDAMQCGFRDTQEAFHYYLEHWNGGRPFILVGHSQGAFSLLNLLKREFNKPELERKLIAAYLFGCSVTDADFTEAPHLKVAEGAHDLGVIIAWNTEATEAVPSPFTNRPGTRCINPLNWRTDDSEAPASLNRGAVFFDGNSRIIKEVPGFCSAKINTSTGALVVVTQIPGQYDNAVFGKGIYHGNDINFFFRNVEINARERAEIYLKQTP